MQWALALQPYQLTVQHCKGSNNGIADIQAIPATALCVVVHITFLTLSDILRAEGACDKVGLCIAV